MTPTAIPATACRSELAIPVRPRDLNTFHSVFGGYVMQRVDAVATALVSDLSGLAAVTARFERMTFHAGIAAFQRMRLTAQGARTFATSMEVDVAVDGEDPATGRRWNSSHATLTVVGLDEGGRPARLPQILPRGEEERQAYEAAGARRAGRARSPGPVLALPAEVGAPDADRLCLERCSRVARSEHAGPFGGASAGWVLAVADELAAVTASRHIGGPAVTAAVDGVSFARPVPVGDVMVLRSYLTAAFRTSVEVRVEVWHRGRYARQEDHVADCAFTYVALDEGGRPAPVPAFAPAGEREAALHRRAVARRESRRAEA